VDDADLLSPLDGLNKPYGTASVQYFRQYFNHFASEQGGNTIDWDRVGIYGQPRSWLMKQGYICQIARFDPSKGQSSRVKSSWGMTLTV
jgi:hypothetical protein